MNYTSKKHKPYDFFYVKNFPISLYGFVFFLFLVFFVFLVLFVFFFLFSFFLLFFFLLLSILLSKVSNAATTTIVISSADLQVFDSTADLVIDVSGTLVTVAADDVISASVIDSSEIVRLIGAVVHAEDALTVTMTMDESQRILSIENSGQPGGDGTAMNIYATSNFVRDIAGVGLFGLTQRSGFVLTEIPDTILPSVVYGEINFDTGVMILTQSETVDSTPSSSVVLNNYAYLLNGNPSVQLAGATTTAFDSYNFTITLSERQRINALQISSTPGGVGLTWTITINEATLTLVAGTTVTQTSQSGTGTIHTAVSNAATTTIIIASADGQVFDITANLVIDVAGTLVTILAEDVTAATDAKAIACTDIKQNFVMYEVMHGVSPYGEFDWTNTDGCSKTDYSDRTCVGTGLLEQTTYKLRVREKCGLPIASGPFKESAEFTTYASKAATPSSIYIATPVTEHQKLIVSWVIGSVSCVTAATTFDLVKVYLMASDDSTWTEEPAGCKKDAGSGNLGDRSIAECTLSGLISDKMYKVKLMEQCISQFRSSPTGNALALNQHQTVTAGYAYTLAEEAQPINSLLYGTTNLSFSWMDLHFMPNVRGCVEAGTTFAGWEIQQKAESGTTWDATSGSCGELITTDIRDNTTISCVALELELYTNYKFQVREVCASTSPIRHSTWVEGSTVQTYRRRASPPTIPTIIADSALRDRMDLKWTSETSGVNTCVEAGSSFGKWRVDFKREAATQWTENGGCAGLTNRASDLACTVNTLAHSSKYVFRVIEVCAGEVVDFNVDSFPSDSSAVSETTVAGPSPPSNIVLDDATRTNVTLDMEFSGSVDNNCGSGNAASAFSKYQAVSTVKDDVDFTTNIIRIEAGTSDSFGTVFHAGEMTLAAGDHIQISGTTASLFNAEFIVRGTPTSTSFEIEMEAAYGGATFTAGYSSDVDTKRGATQALGEVAGGQGIIIKWSAVSGCDLTDDTVTACTGIALLPNSAYQFRFRETCTDPLSTSYWSESSPVAYTLASNALPPTVSSEITCVDCKGDKLRVSWVPDDSSCVSSMTSFEYWEVQVSVEGADTWSGALGGCDYTDKCRPAATNAACSSISAPANQVACDPQSVGTCAGGGGIECTSVVEGPEATCTGTTDSIGSPCAWTSTNLCTYAATSLDSYNTLICEAESLHDHPDAVANLGTEYKFRVREVCTDTDKTSVYSAISAGVYTHAYCVAGTRVNNTLPRICTNCEIGRHADVLGLWECKQCPIGKFSDVLGLDVCKDCMEGTFENRLESTECLDCEIGQYADQQGVEACLDCLPGTFADVVKLAICKDCPKGYYIGDNQALKCKGCSRGRFTDANGMPKCLDCQAGFYSKASKFGNCTACPKGRAQIQIMSIACNDCGIGKYSPVMGMPECIDCDPGYYSNEQTSENFKCKDCPAGFFGLSKSMTACIQCLDGTYSASSGTALCSKCPQGYMGLASENVRDKCKTCQCTENCDALQGTYQDELGMQECKSCPTGFFTSNYTLAPPSCAKCSRGLYADQEGSGSCIFCPPGKYTNDSSTVTCKDCPSGYEAFKPDIGNQSVIDTAGLGSVLCRACVVGQYQTLAGSEIPCKSCIKNEYSQEEGTPTCDACPAGWRSGIGAFECTPDCGSDDSTNKCQPGSKWSTVTERCDDCTPGKQCNGVTAESVNGEELDCDTDEARASGRKVCPIGTHEAFDVEDGYYAFDSGALDVLTNENNAKNLDTTKRCEVGYECTDGKKREKCVVGKYANLVGTKGCRKCEGGTYQDELGQIDCKICSPGFRCPLGAPKQLPCTEMNSTTKQYCPSGTADGFIVPPGYVTTGNVINQDTNLENCRAGTECNDGILIICTPGKFAPEERSTTCEECAIGKYNSESESISCIDCVPGFAQSVSGSTKCERCGAGFYASEVGATSCEMCLAGQFNEYELMPGCYHCPAGYESPQQAATGCSSCEPGTYSREKDYLSGSSKCETCKPGYICDPYDFYTVLREDLLFAPSINMNGVSDDDKPISCRSLSLTPPSDDTCRLCPVRRYRNELTEKEQAKIGIGGPNTPACLTCDFFGEVGCRVDSDRNNEFDYLFTDGYGPQNNMRKYFFDLQDNMATDTQNSNDNVWRFQTKDFQSDVKLWTDDEIDKLGSSWSSKNQEFFTTSDDCTVFTTATTCTSPKSKKFRPVNVCSWNGVTCEVSTRGQTVEIRRPITSKEILNPHIDIDVVLNLPTRNETVIVKPRRRYGSSGNDITRPVYDLGPIEKGRVIAQVACSISDPNTGIGEDRCPEFVFWGWTGDDPRCNEETGQWCNKAVVRKACYAECDKCAIDHYQPNPKATECVACLRGQNAPEGQEKCGITQNKVCSDKSLDMIVADTLAQLEGDLSAVEEKKKLETNLESCELGLFPLGPQDNADNFASRKDVESKCMYDEHLYGRKMVPGLGAPWLIEYSFNNYYDVDKNGLLSEEEFIELRREVYGKAWEETTWKKIAGNPDAEMDLAQFTTFMTKEVQKGWSPIDYLWQGGMSNKTVDSCSVAEAAWNNECKNKAIALCEHKLCKSQGCAANQRSPTNVLHIYNQQIMSPWVEREKPPDVRENGPINTTMEVPAIPEKDDITYPYDIYGKASPPRWFKIEWDPPEFVKGTLMYYFVEITKSQNIEENGEFGDSDKKCGKPYPETSRPENPGNDLECEDPKYYPQGFPLPESRVEADCGRVSHMEKGLLYKPCQLKWNVQQFPHLTNYFFRVIAVVDYYDSASEKQIYAQAKPEEYQKNNQYTTAMKCTAADPTGWVTISGEYLETRRRPVRLYDEKTDRYDFGLKKEHAWRFEEDLMDPWKWNCRPCPHHADCRSCGASAGAQNMEIDRCFDYAQFAPRAWWEVRGLFGSWRPSRVQQLQFMTGINWKGEIAGGLQPGEKTSLNHQIEGFDGFVDRVLKDGQRGLFNADKGEVGPIDKSMYPYNGTYAARRHSFGGVLNWYRCPYRQSCLGSENPPEVDRYYMNGTDLESANLAEWQLTERCATEHGHTGIACAICFPSTHYMTSTGCATCEEITGGSIGVKLTIIFGVIGMAGGILYKFRSLRYVAKDVSRVGKILVNFVQVMGAIKDVYTLEIPSMNVGFNFAQYFQMFSFDLVSLFGIPCLIQMTYYEQYVADMTVIAILLILVFIVYLCAFMYLKARDSNGGKERRSRKKLQKILETSKKTKAAIEARLEAAEEKSDSDTDSDDDAPKKQGGGKSASAAMSMFSGKPGLAGKITGKNRWTGLKKGLFSVRSFRKSKMTAMVRLKATCLMAAYYVLLFQHQPSAVKTFNMFKCIKIEGTLWLRPDLRLTCFPFSWPHYIAMFIMIFFVFGFPAVTVYVLYKRRNNLADPIVSAQYGFLYTPYRPHAYWWEAQLITHKIALTAGLVLLYQSAIVQCSAAFSISIMSWAMHSSFKPFKSSRLNMLQHWCLFATSIAFVGNLAYQCVANSTDGEASSKGIVKWFITFMFAGAIIRVLTGGIQETMSAWKNYEDIMLGKRQEKKLEAEKKAKERKAKKNAGKVKKITAGKKKGGVVAVLPVGGARRITKAMPTQRKRIKQNAKYLGVHKVAGSKGGKSKGLLGALGAGKKKPKVTMISV